MARLPLSERRQLALTQRLANDRLMARPVVSEARPERPRRWLIMTVAAATVLSVGVTFGQLVTLHVPRSPADILYTDSVSPP